MKLTTEQRAELKALADAATPGPWWSGNMEPADGHALAWVGSAFVECNGGRLNYAAPSQDAEFIAAAREAIPALLADQEEDDRILRATVPEAFKNADSAVGAVQSYVAHLETELAAAKEELEEWRFTNKVDELCRRVDRAESELAATRKQLAEAQALLKTREQSYVGVVADHCDRILWRDHYYSIASIVAINTAIAEAVEPYKRDAERYRWLTEDHAKHDTRATVYEIATALNIRGKGSTDAAIDAALAAKEKPKAGEA